MVGVMQDRHLRPMTADLGQSSPGQAEPAQLDQSVAATLGCGAGLVGSGRAHQRIKRGEQDGCALRVEPSA